MYLTPDDVRLLILNGIWLVSLAAGVYLDWSDDCPGWAR